MTREIDDNRLAPLRAIAFDEYVLAPSGNTYHQLGAAAFKGLTPPKPRQVPQVGTLAILPGAKPAAVTVGDDGRLGIDGAYKSGDELSAIAGLATLGLKDPFATISDEHTLAAIASDWLTAIARWSS